MTSSKPKITKIRLANAEQVQKTNNMEDGEFHGQLEKGGIIRLYYFENEPNDEFVEVDFFQVDSILKDIRLYARKDSL